jgi:hypothetical protein
MTLASATVLLFLVIDPFGNVPFFVSALNRPVGSFGLSRLLQRGRVLR